MKTLHTGLVFLYQLKKFGVFGLKTLLLTLFLLELPIGEKYMWHFVLKKHHI